MFFPLPFSGLMHVPEPSGIRKVLQSKGSSFTRGTTGFLRFAPLISFGAENEELLLLLLLLLEEIRQRINHPDAFRLLTAFPTCPFNC